MTLSEEHENIIDDVRSAWNNWAWKSGKGTINTWMAIDHAMAKCIQPELPADRRADAYINIDDKYPCIVLEVGRMEDGKWKNISYKIDKKPVRVLRVGFDRVPYLLHRRRTERETDFFDYLEKWFEDIRNKQDNEHE